MNNKELKEEIENSLRMMATPIDFPTLLESGLLKKIGKSYYTDNILKLPKSVSAKISSISNTKHGSRLTFYKETRALRALKKNTVR